MRFLRFSPDQMPYLVPMGLVSSNKFEQEAALHTLSTLMSISPSDTYKEFEKHLKNLPDRLEHDELSERDIQRCYIFRTPEGTLSTEQGVYIAESFISANNTKQAKGRFRAYENSNGSDANSSHSARRDPYSKDISGAGKKDTTKPTKKTGTTLLVPIVRRRLRERSPETKKKAAQIAGNMCSLVMEPRDMVPYIGLLLPEVKKVPVDPIPEFRSVAARAIGSLIREMGEDNFPDLVPEQRSVPSYAQSFTSIAGLGTKDMIYLGIEGRSCEPSLKVPGGTNIIAEDDSKMYMIADGGMIGGSGSKKTTEVLVNQISFSNAKGELKYLSEGGNVSFIVVGKNIKEKPYESKGEQKGKFDDIYFLTQGSGSELMLGFVNDTPSLFLDGIDLKDIVSIIVCYACLIDTESGGFLEIAEITFQQQWAASKSLAGLTSVKILCQDPVKKLVVRIFMFEDCSARDKARKEYDSKGQDVILHPTLSKEAYTDVFKSSKEYNTAKPLCSLQVVKKDTLLKLGRLMEEMRKESIKRQNKKGAGGSA
ncbi:eIF-2-alpha kinase activator GCN1 [Orobanche minor]